ncbi:MAG: DUF6470 family protein [Paenibacillaceae bacterium]
MNIPIVQLRTQPMILGIDTTKAKIEIEQPRADFKLEIKKPGINMQSPRGDLQIDQSRAWDALAVGSHLETMNSIFAVVKNIVLTTIGRIASEGDQLAAIHKKTNAIADIAANRRIDRVELAFAGHAGPDNVDISYTERKVQFEPVRGEVHIEANPNLPRFNYVPGNLNIHVKQYNKLEMIPPQIDLKV